MTRMRGVNEGRRDTKIGGGRDGRDTKTKKNTNTSKQMKHKHIQQKRTEGRRDIQFKGRKEGHKI